MFSRPVLLKKWLREHGLTVAQREHLITDAGQLIPGFTRADDGLEFFVHSPFAMRADDGEVVDRNRDALVVQATFVVSRMETKAILASDIDHDVIADIVTVTQRNRNSRRLEWDIVKLPHHCSYRSLGPDKGGMEDEAHRASQVALRAPRAALRPRHLDKQPHSGGRHGSAAPSTGGRRTIGRWLRPRTASSWWTMEHPNQRAPKPLVIKITGRGRDGPQDHRGRRGYRHYAPVSPLLARPWTALSGGWEIRSIWRMCVDAMHAR